MYNHYKKVKYAGYAGFQLHHTSGLDAGASTTDYPHLSQELMLIYFLHGSGKIIVEGSTYPIREGDVIFTTPTELYHCTIDPQVYHERIVLHIHPQFLEQFPCDTSGLLSLFTDHHPKNGNRIPADFASESGLGKRLTELFTLVQQADSSSNILAICKVAELLVLLQQTAGSVTAGNEDLQKNRLQDQLLDYLNQNFTQNITVDSVAAHFHITPSHLAHVFKKHIGLSLWNYVILRRLRLANGYMQQGMSTEEACYRVGFDNYANFYRLYKKYMGFPPSRYKKQIQ